jgi:hypothetical protein
MNSTVEILVWGIAVPAVASVFIFGLTRWLLPADVGERYSLAVAFAAAYCIGYALLPEWVRGELIPKRHWHWIFYLAPAAALFGPVTLADGVYRVERWLHWLVAAFISALLLAPNWSNLQPPRSVWLIVLSVYLFLFPALLEPLARNLAPRMYLAILTLSSACIAALILAAISVTYGRVAVIGVGGIAGCWLASFIGPKAGAVRGFSFVYAVVVGGWAFVGCIEPQPPQQPAVGFLLAAMAPATQWLCVKRPMGRREGVAAIVVQLLVVLAVLGLFAGWVFMTAGMSQVDEQAKACNPAVQAEA